MSATKRRLLVYGNCQGGWLAAKLSETPAVAERYELTYLSDYQVRPVDHPIHQPFFLPSCSCVIWQTAAGCKPPDIISGLNPNCRQIRFPTLWLKLLWPTYAVDPRNQPEPNFPWGRYPYGDRLVMKLLDAGVSLEDLPKRYSDTDLNTVVNLDRFTEMSMKEMHYNDQQSDVAIAPFIERMFRERKLFGAVNHPTMLTLNHLYHGLLGLLLNSTGPTDPPYPDNAADTLGSEETPLHPQIISHHRLKWAYPGMKWRYHSAFFALPDYLRAYAAFDPIPLGDTPALWMARAKQEADHRNFPEAKRLLLEGVAKFPDVVQFLQFLGLLLLQENAFVEAEKVYRFAISRHSAVADLHCKLGLSLLRQGLPQPARLSFDEALRIDTNSTESKRYLTQISAARNL